MLLWLSERHNDSLLGTTATRIESAVSKTLQAGIGTGDLGGKATTSEVTKAVIDALG